MDAYHNPYNKDHRYWIGLLSLVRVLLYLVSALNVLGDPCINLLSITLVIVVLLVFQRVIEIKYKMHKNRFNDAFEIASLLNLSFLSSVTFFITEDKESQNVVAYISSGVGFGTFLAILAYHTYKFILEKRFTTKCSKCLHKLQGSQKQLPLQTTVPVFSDEQPASETEIDALPGPENTNAADLDDMDTETSEGTAQYLPNTNSNPSNGHPHECNSQYCNTAKNDTTETKLELPILSSCHELANKGNRHSIHMKVSSSSFHVAPRNPRPPIGNETTHIEIELPELASGQELATTDLFQPSVVIVTNQEDDNEDPTQFGRMNVHHCCYKTNAKRYHKL